MPAEHKSSINKTAINAIPNCDSSIDDIVNVNIASSKNIKIPTDVIFCIMYRRLFVGTYTLFRGVATIVSGWWREQRVQRPVERRRCCSRTAYQSSTASVEVSSQTLSAVSANCISGSVRPLYSSIDLEKVERQQRNASCHNCFHYTVDNTAMDRK